MTNIRRVSLMVLAALVPVGCPAPPVAIEPTAPVASIPPPAAKVVPSITPEVPLPATFQPLIEEKRKTRDGLVEVLARGDMLEAKRSPALEADVTAMLRYYNHGLHTCNGLAKGARSGLLARIVREIKRDIDFYEANDLGGVVLRLRYELGRALALAGDVDRACREGFDLAIKTHAPAGATDQMREYVDLHHSYAFYMKAKSLFGAGRFDEVIATVDSMSGRFPQALDTDQGNQALLYKAEALTLKDPPDHEAALRDAKRVIQKGKGRWPTIANMLIMKVSATVQRDEVDADLPPRAWLQTALGLSQRAARATDAAERRRLRESAVDACRRAISACRGRAIALRERLDIESSAWFELGMVYSRMALWYEASFAFDAVTKRFSEVSVGRMLAKERGLQDALAEVRRRIASGDVKADEGDDPPSEHELLYAEAAKTPEWSETLKKLEERSRKSANNLMVAARRGLRDSRSDFDRKRLDDLVGGDRDPAKARDLDFHLGLLARAEAEGHAKRDETRKAIERWKAAAGRFGDTARANEAKRALARHLEGQCLLEAAMATLFLAEKEPGLKAEAKRLGHEAYRAFEAFENDAQSAGPGPDVAAAKKRAARLDLAAEAKTVIEKAFGPPME